jgi:hypothetical protein
MAATAVATSQTNPAASRSAMISFTHLTNDNTSGRSAADAAASYDYTKHGANKKSESCYTAVVPK